MLVTDVAGSIVHSVKGLPRRVFGTRNDRVLKRMRRVGAVAGPYEPRMRALCSDGEDYDSAFAARSADVPRPAPDDEDALAAYERSLQAIRVALSAPLRAHSDAFAEQLRNGRPMADALPEGLAILREASRRARAHRHFDCQLIGGQVLCEGQVAEMRTGEGKTIVCHLAAYMKIAEGKKVHVVTVNDYLVRRDAEFAMPIFELLGISVGYIQAQVDPGGREGVRRAAYACDITYGTTSEFGFDYLRDNMKVRYEDQVQGRLDFAIIDEVDSVLIDEARTPLIISGPAYDDVTRYPRADKVAGELVRRQKPWDRRVAATVARFDGDTQGIPKLADAMAILGYSGKGRRVAGDDAPGEGAGDAQDEASGDAPRAGGDAGDGAVGAGDAAEGPTAALGPDFLTDDQVEAIQTYESSVLKLPPAEQYRRYFIVQRERKQVQITHDGVTIAQDLLDMGSLYSGANMEWPHLIENALRAHKVYERDKDYVVQNGEVIIVDPFTGRLMYGRQWSDGLHQAVEAKERVQVKEETQTLATITIQNYFKLYKEKAGMTGTAMTEANEFMKIYGLDVVEIPTNRPVNRVDHNDKMYRDEEEKYNAIVDEIHEIHRRGRPADPYLIADVLTALKPIMERQGQDTGKVTEALRQFHAAETEDVKVIRFMLEAYDDAMGDLIVGRPILVGTTSVENSEKLSRLLERRYGIEHEVLNAKNHAREAEIVMKAGEQTVPTRGDKTPRGNVTIATNMAGRGTDIKLGASVVYAKCRVPETLPEGAVHSELYPIGLTKCCINCEEYDPATNCAHCFKPKLDPRFPELGRRVCARCTPCGLHIIGTERHEARRIDNQLRGRSARQGDPGSSRFSLSLQDDLLKLFMSDWMLKMMEKLGFADGGSLEDKRLNKGIERAQKKVEERNFGTRKHLLEWDEPMDYQRTEFYRSRQRILEGRGLAELIFDTIDNAIRTTVGEFLSGTYDRTCIVEWCRSKLDITVDEESLDTEDLESAQQSVRRKARDEAHEMIRTSLGEYIDVDAPPSKWDVGGLLQWAQRLFKVSLTQNQMRRMTPEDIEQTLLDAADAHYAALELDGIAVFLAPAFAKTALIEWARAKFDIALSLDDLAEKSQAEIIDLIDGRVREAYARRELSYPAEICLERAFGDDGAQTAAAADTVVQWVNHRYRVGWTLNNIQGRSRDALHRELVELQEAFLCNGRLEAEVRDAVSGKTAEEAATWGRERFAYAWDQAGFDAHDGDIVDALVEQGRRMLRWELTRLEHMVLLRIYDQAWKDHLLEMDHLKHAIMQRPLGGDQTHPQSQFAIEGRDLFNQMWSRIAARVTDIIFKIRIGPDADAAGSGTVTTGGGLAPVSLGHADATGAGFSAMRDQEAAMRAQGQQTKTETIRRAQPKVGRNAPCPCGSGKKYKQCHGKGA